MNSLESYTDKQLEDISNEDVERIIRWECAEEGVKFLLPPKKESYEEIKIPKDDQAYKVSGFDCYFRDRKLAEELSEWAQARALEILENDYDSDYSYQYLIQKGAKYGTGESYAVEVCHFYRREVLAEKASILQKRKKAEETYKRENEAYQKDAESFQKVSTWVWDRVNEAKEKKASRERHKKVLSEYLEIAQGEKEVAKQFFEKAYPECRFSFEELCP